MTNSFHDENLREVLRHSGWIKGLAFATLRDHALAEDVTQEVLLKALQTSRPKGRLLRAWLKAVTVNTARSQIRSSMRRRKHEQALARDKASHQVSEHPDGIQTFLALTKAVDSLSVKSRQMILLRFYQELPFSSIADELGIRVGNAQVRCHRALQELRSVLTSANEDWKNLCLLALPIKVQKLATLGSGGIPYGLALNKFPGMWAAGLLAVLSFSLFLIANPFGQDQAVEFASSPFSEGNRKSLAADLRHPVSPIRSLAVAPEEHPSSKAGQLRGRVFHQGSPVSDVQVKMWQVDQLHSATTDADGFFEFPADLNRYAGFTVIADGMGRSAQYYPGNYQMPRLDLIAPNPKGERMYVYHGDPAKPVPGAKVEVFVDLTAMIGEDYSPKQSLQWAAEGYTDENGHFYAPGWLTDMPVVLKASAPGYLPAVSNFGRKVRILAGKEMPVRLINADKKPLAGLRVRIGRLGFEARKTDGNGFLSKVNDWKVSKNWQQEVALPGNIFLDLGDGKYWQRSASSIPLNQFQVLEDHIEITVDLQPVYAKLGDLKLPHGFWVEARLPGGRSEFFSIPRPGSWTKLNSGKAVVLDQPIGGSHNQVEARLMPDGTPLGLYSIDGSVAVVETQIVPVEFQVTRNQHALGGDFVLKGQGGMPANRFIHILRNGKGKLFLDPNPRWRFSVTGHGSDQDYFLDLEELPYGKITQSLEIHGLEKFPKLELPLLDVSTRVVKIRINGIPPVDGLVGKQPIQSDGSVRLPFDRDGRPLLRGVRLTTHPSLQRREGGPIVNGLHLKRNDPYPGKIWQDPSGNWYWDMHLAAVELHIPVEKFDGFRSIYSTVGGLWPDLHWPIEREKQFLKVPPEGGPVRFRVPAGRYAFEVNHKYRFGGIDGVVFEAGKLTSLHPDAVDLAAERLQQVQPEGESGSTPATPQGLSYGEDH